MVWDRRMAVGAVVVLLGGLLVYGFWPAATPVTIETVTRDSLRVTVEEEGQTQLRERYVVSAPTTGYLRRVPGEVGETVRAGEVLARLATLPAKVLDASDYAAADAQVRAARAALRRAQEEAAGAEAALAYAQEEHRRLRRLHEQGTASQQQLDQARVEFQKARAQHRAAQQAVAQARGELDAARSRLAPTSGSPDSLPTRTPIRAPTDGQLLRVHQKSAGVVQAGTPVELVHWGGAGTLTGRVRAVPPQGRTEVSALGVEEQRVEVLVDLTSAPAQWTALGAGYRVVARFITWAGADVLQVPQSALFRHDGGWAVFAVQDGRAVRRPVEVGHRSGLRVQVLDGVSEGDRVITHPGKALSAGARVEAR